MDNFVLRWIALELDERLRQERLGKAYQLGTTDLALDLRLRDGAWLLVSTSPQKPGIFLTRRQPRDLGVERRTDTPFISLLRKYLGGARLLGIEKLGYDRVLFLTFRPTDERERRLIVSLIGRASDVLIVEENQILASLRHPDQNPAYEPPAPPIDKLDPYQCTPEKLREIIATSDGDVEAAARHHLIGFTSTYAREFAERSKSSPHFNALQEILAELTRGPLIPSAYSPVALDDLLAQPGRDDFEIVLSPIELTHLAKWATSRFPDMNAAADAVDQIYAARQHFVSRKQEIVSRLKTRLKRLRGLAANLSRELELFSNADKLQRWGELLLANLQHAARHDDVFIVTDFYDETMPQVEIPTREQPGPKEAAELYFKLARKARHGSQVINNRLPAVKGEIDILERELASVSAATGMQQLSAHEAPKRQTEPSDKRPARSMRTKTEPIRGVRRYRSSDGYEILVGRADRDNDALTFRVAKSHDLWFHAADYPGSHVVLRNPTRREVPHRAITEAAQLAAQFSHARAETKAAVNYCERKFVSKPKGFAPGQVRVSSFKTILVQPREVGERIVGE